MQLFVTHHTSVLCAPDLDDGRLTRTITDATSMLATALHRHRVRDNAMPGPANARHPIVHWCGNGRDNFAWVTNYLNAAHDEFARRFDRAHPLKDLAPLIDGHYFEVPDKPLEPFVNLAYSERHSLDFRHYDVPWSYRNYLNARWLGSKCTWTRSNPPTYYQGDK